MLDVKCACFIGLQSLKAVLTRKLSFHWVIKFCLSIFIFVFQLNQTEDTFTLLYYCAPKLILLVTIKVVS